MINSMLTNAEIYGGRCLNECPYHTAEGFVCAASISSMIVGEPTLGDYCKSERFTDCPVFLSRLMMREE